MWTDNEAALDYLNFSGVAETVAELELWLVTQSSEVVDYILFLGASTNFGRLIRYRSASV
jgi:hypothetical protein